MNYFTLFIALFFATAGTDFALPTASALDANLLAAPTKAQPALSKETTNDYKVFKNKKTVCLKARFSTHFKSLKTVWNVGTGAVVNNASSTCGKLSVTFAAGHFVIRFGQHASGDFFINAVDASLFHPNVHASVTNLTDAKAPNGSSYACTTGISIFLSRNVTMHMKNLQIQPFYVKDGKFGAARRCKADISPVVPIIIGVVLLGLMLLVVVAYFIGRSRSRVGYEEI